MPTTTSFWELPIATLEKALDIRKRIEVLKAQEAGIMSGGSPFGTPTKRRGRPPKTAAVVSVADKVDGRKGKRSKAARAKMAAAQKARWAAKKGGEVAPPAEPTTAHVVSGSKKKKRTMSPEARARIAAAQKARWAKVKS